MAEEYYGFDFIDPRDFEGDTNFGETVGGVGKILSDLFGFGKDVSGIASDILGGGGDKSQGFVPQKNSALETAIRVQSNYLSQASGRQERSSIGTSSQPRPRNIHSSKIINSLFQDNEYAFRQLHAKLMTQAKIGSGGTKYVGRSRVT